MTSLEETTLALVEGYATPQGDEPDRFRRLTSELADRMTGGESASRAYSAALAAGSIDEILAAAAALDAENRMVGIRNTVMSDLRGRASGAIRGGRRTFSAAAVAPALTHLHTQLADLLGRVRALGDVEASSAERAIETGRIEEYKTTVALCDEYAEIRRLQRQLTLTLVSRDDAPDAAALSMSGYFRDALDTEDVWRDRRTAAAHQRTALDEDEEHATWLAEAPALPWRRAQAATFPDGDRYGYLLWIATNARPWVPTIPELIDAHARNLLILDRPADRMRLAEITDALDTYRQETK